MVDGQAKSLSSIIQFALDVLCMCAVGESSRRDSRSLRLHSMANAVGVGGVASLEYDRKATLLANAVTVTQS